MQGVSVQHHQLNALQKDHPTLCGAFYMFVFELSYLHSGIVHAILIFILSVINTCAYNYFMLLCVHEKNNDFRC